MMKEYRVTIDQAKDTALAVILVLLLAMLFTGNEGYLPPAIGVLLLAMTWPAFFKGPARWWFGISRFLGTIVSKILLTVIYVVVATPIGQVRRLGGADAMRRKAWKKGTTSAFVERNHTYKAADVEQPY